MHACTRTHAHTLQNNPGFYYRDLIAIHTIAVINAGFCDYHMRHCAPSQELLDVCEEVRECVRER